MLHQSEMASAGWAKLEVAFDMADDGMDKNMTREELWKIISPADLNGKLATA